MQRFRSAKPGWATKIPAGRVRFVNHVYETTDAKVAEQLRAHPKFNVSFFDDAAIEAASVDETCTRAKLAEALGVEKDVVDTLIEQGMQPVAGKGASARYSLSEAKELLAGV